MTNSLEALNYLQKHGKSQVKWIDVEEENVDEYKELNKQIKSVKEEIKKIDPKWVSEEEENSEVFEEEKEPFEREDFFSNDEDSVSEPIRNVVKREADSPKESTTERNLEIQKEITRVKK